MFPKINPKQSFAKLEEEILKFWKENNTFEKSIETRPEENSYRFYDGPPFITGTPHYGSLLSSICKDVVPRYQTMQGKRVERVWGWDCHGIPIEDKVQKKLGLESNKDIEKVGMKTFIDECYNYTTSTSAEWEWYVDHIGRWVDFKNSYKTMDQDYMESVIQVFKKLYDKGLIYKGQRTSLYSWKLSTPISNFEIAMDDSYEEVSDPAITVMFPLISPISSKGEGHGVRAGDYILAWTTTPWTIPAHMAIAVNKDLAYSRVLSDGKYYILATARVEAVFKGREYEIVDSFMGDSLVGLHYKAPFDYYQGKVDPEKNHLIYHAEFVTDSDGVGIAHEAPEFGDVDFELAKAEGIHISSALDNEGRYTDEISDLKGTHYRDANEIVSERLKEKGLLFKKESINHRVAMCPRTGTPLIYKVQDSWFIDIQSLKDRLIEENEGINWSPEHLKHGQFLKSMEGAPDWCISRTRYWGAPMPIWKAADGSIKVLGSRQEIYEANKVYGQLEEKDGQYFVKQTGKELDFHRPYIDEILAKNEENFKAQNVLGIHGFKRTEAVEDFLAGTKNNLANQGITMDCPAFEIGTNISYKNWGEVLDSLDVSKYDTWLCHSLGCRVALEYIIEKKIQLKRLVLIAPGTEATTPEVNEFYSTLQQDISTIKTYVGEVVVVASQDDTVHRQAGVKEIVSTTGAELVQLDGYGHFNVKENSIIEGITTCGAPMQRIPEVLDCWVESGSMPYAQMHYPFENKQAMEASYPADFIVEYIGQVRAWFYVMHVLGVALFDQRSFTNVITTGIVNGSDGRKMSKSYKNYPDPRITIETYGADAIRFYMMNSPLMSGGNLSFKEEQVQEVVKKVILPLWNTYSFFTTYANIDGYEPATGGVYYIRHAETETNVNFNSTGAVSGAGDNPSLTENGIAQAINAGKKLQMAGVQFDYIVSSNLERTLETAKLVAQEIGFHSEITIIEDLKEQNYSDFEGKSHKEIADEYGLDINDKPALRRVFKNSKVENYHQFDARVTMALEDFLKGKEGKNILIVGHAGTARPIFRKYLHLDIDYAHLEMPTLPNAKVIKLPSTPLTNPLDKWVLSELNKLIIDVTNGMETYKINEATRPIIRFMDNLTNWYIRRSRKRFWKSENDGDKTEAYNTLHHVLVELSKIIAPFMPFLAESLYQGLTGQESVHLTTFPEKNPSFILQDLNHDMDITQTIITLGLAWRANHKIRVRQPLQSITIGEKLESYYLDIIKEELNVKEVIVLDDASQIAKKVCRPNGRLIGPKFGANVKFIISEAKAGNFTELEDGKVLIRHPELDSGSSNNDSISSTEGQIFILEGDEFEIAFEAGDSDYDIEAGMGMVIAMDGTITPELELEGYARDIVRHIQEARKEAGYEVDDRIQLHIYHPLTPSLPRMGEQEDILKKVIEKFGSYIETETLSAINTSLSSGDLEKDVEVEGVNVSIVLKK